MSSYGFTRNAPATESVLAAIAGWVATVFGGAAALFFSSWVLASLQSNQHDLADRLFYAFSFSFVVAMGLGELRRRRKLGVLRPNPEYYNY